MLVRNHGEKQRSKSNQRRKLKSPIRIKDKIKELEEKLQREAGCKEMPKKQRFQQKEIVFTHKQSTPKQEQLPPFKTIQRSRPQAHSSQKYGNSIFSASRHPQTSKKASEREDIIPKAFKILRRQSQRQLPSRMKQFSRDEQSLQRLKIENEKYKQIYSKSQQKMQELETVLNSIKGKHEEEKCLLKKTIDNLQKKIEEKKINLGHLYAYDEKGNNFLIVHDRIIAETDNENSSSPPQAPSKKNSVIPSLKLKATPEFSNLSVESK